MKTLTEFSLVVLRRAAAARAARTGEGLEGEALITAIAGDLSLQEDRAKRLVEALDVVGAGLDKVRLVRVFQGEQGPPGSTAVGEFHYAIDRAQGPETKRRGRDDRGERRGGDRDRGGGGGGGGGFGGMFGGPKRDKPRGLGSLKAAAAGTKPEERDDRPQRGEVPRAGIGWQLTAAPRDPRDDRGRGKGRGRPGDRDRRGPRGPRPDGGGPGGDRRDRGGWRGDRGPRPQGAEAAAGGGGPGGGGPGGGGPGGGGPGGPRPEGDRGRGRGRRGGGRGPGGPRPGGPPGQGGPREPRVNVEGAPQVQAQPEAAPPSEPATSVTPPTPPATTEPQT